MLQDVPDGSVTGRGYTLYLCSVIKNLHSCDASMFQKGMWRVITKVAVASCLVTRIRQDSPLIDTSAEQISVLKLEVFEQRERIEAPSASQSFTWLAHVASINTKSRLYLYRVVVASLSKMLTSFQFKQAMEA